MKMKKRIVSLAVVVIMLSIAAMGTLAYFVDEAQVHNIITTAAIDITLNDKTIIGEEVVDFPNEDGGIKGVMPGTSVSKIVSVTNEGAGPAWVRIRLEECIIAADGATELQMELADGTAAYEINFEDGTSWTQGTDGHWYWARELAVGETTDTLFESVSFNPALGNEYQSCTVQITVAAEAVQVINNPLPASGLYEEIPGWPETTENE